MKNRLIKDIGFSNCALCKKSNDIRESHIIPSFVYRWLIDTSATGFIRCGEVPNKRMQDGWRPKMLCGNCEQKFGAWEKYFADNCFYPITNGKETMIQYQSWMLKYATSVSWRILRAFKAIGGIDCFSENMRREVDVALNFWNAFLLDKKPHPGEHEQHLFLVDAVTSSTFTDVPKNINRYFLRAIDIYVACNSNSAFTYAKMGKFILFGFIKMPYPRRWKGTKLNANSGSFGAKNIELPLDVGEFLMGRAQRLVKKMKLLSKKQQGEIDKAYKQSKDRVLNSGTFRATQYDINLFGGSALDVFTNEH